MSRPDSRSLKDVAILTKSIEVVIRNLVKILIGKISLVRLQELTQNIFVEEAENALRKERPGKDVPLTSLAVVTGMDTRKLAKIRNSDAYRQPLHSEREFLSGMTPENSIVELWTSNPRFTDQETGKPFVIDLWGEEGSFEILVKEAVRSRGVTVKSFVNRMEQNEFIKVRKGERVELNTKTLASRKVRKHIGNIKLGLDAVGHLLGTVHYNLELEDDKKHLFQRGSWTHRLDSSNRQALETKIADYLTETDGEVRSILESFEENRADDWQLTAGVGMYYFEKESF